LIHAMNKWATSGSIFNSATMRKKHVELLAYDEKLRHHPDMRIKLDLDDGVKVNYGKFGDLLSDVKAVTGGKEE